MSKYWDPAWTKPTTVLSLLHPDEDTIDALEAAIRPPGWEDGPTPSEFCFHEGRTTLANFGPDFVLVVPAVHRVETAELQREIGRLTYYFICTRPRIRARDDCRIHSGVLELHFEVSLDDGSVIVLERAAAAPKNVSAVRSVDNGAAVNFDLSDGFALHESALLAQGLFRPTPWAASYFDLDVRYIGRARGALKETCALDRLESHAKYQRVMEEVLAGPHRNRDVWLVLGAGTSMDISGFVEPELQVPDPAELLRDENRIRSTLSTARRIDVTEALLINHFKPPWNEQHVGELDLNSKTFKHCYEAGLTGLQLALPTHKLGLALYTEHQPPTLWHVETVCLF